MVSVHGRKAKPLPAYLTERLLGLGMVRMPDVEPATFRHPQHPPLRLQIVASNVPNNTELTVALNGTVSRMEADAVVAMMEFRLGVLGSPNRAMREPHDSRTTDLEGVPGE
jgi:hypothetical protein